VERYLFMFGVIYFYVQTTGFPRVLKSPKIGQWCWKSAGFG